MVRQKLLLNRIQVYHDSHDSEFQLVQLIPSHESIHPNSFVLKPGKLVEAPIQPTLTGALVPPSY